MNAASRDDLQGAYAELMGTLCQARFDDCTDNFYKALSDPVGGPMDKAALIRVMCKIRLKVWWRCFGVDVEEMDVGGLTLH